MRVMFHLQIEWVRESHSLLSSKAHTLECQHGGSSHQAEDLNYMKPPWMKGYSTSHAYTTCTRITWETYKPCAQEAHRTCIGHVHEMQMGCTKVACTGITWDAHKPYAQESHLTHMCLVAWGEGLSSFSRHVLQWMGFHLRTSRS